MKRTGSILLALAMLLSSLAAFPAGALANNNATQITFSVCDGGMFTLEPTEIAVTADLSDTYAAEVGYNDNAAEPTILDAILAAHIAMFGEDFMEYAPFKASSASSTTESFGESTYALTYRLNGAISKDNVWYNLDTAIADGDYIEYMFYQDTTGWSDAYTSFANRQETVLEKQSLTLTLQAEGYDASYNTVLSPASGVTITVDGTEAGITNDKGQVTLSFDQAGTYTVSAAGDRNGTPIFLPYCSVTVGVNPLSSYMETQMQGAAAYYLSETASKDISIAINYLACLKSGLDMHAYTPAFLQSVTDNLKENNGKLMQSGAESIGLYGAVIQILDELNMNPENFNGYNLIESFAAMPALDADSPYLCRVAIEAAAAHGKTALAKSIADEMLTQYTMGKGFSYWGFACDNTAMFIAALTPVRADYESYYTDALSVLDTYKTDGGYFYAAEYGKTPSSNSTALALMAYTLAGNADKAKNAYLTLVAEYQTDTGIFTYAGEKSTSSSKDALIALAYYKASVDSNGLNFHVAVKDAALAATCTADGKTEGAHCAICGEVITAQTVVPAAGHHWDDGKITAATCTAAGTKTYTCTVCGTTTSQTIDKTEHTYKSFTTKATTSKNGSIVTKCTGCNNVSKTTTIYYPKTITLSKTSYVYNGKVQKPKVTVKGSNGKVISSSNYTVTYAKGRKNVGKYTVTIKFKGNYSGTVKKTFTIKPKATSISKLTAGKKKFTVKWKKQATQTTGYQIQYSTNKSFKKNNKTMTVSKNKTASKTIAKLSAKKKYYVRIRTYKIVKINGKNTKIYSAWSKTKTVTTKK